MGSRVVKWLIIVVVGLVGLCLIAVVSLPFIINPNDYKVKISAAVKEQTGREISIPGDITLHVSPKLDVAFTLGEIRLGPGPGFSGTAFATSKRAEIKFALWPLLTQKELQVNTVELDGVQLNLIKNVQGKTNWEDLAGSEVSAATPSAPKQAEPSPQSGSAGKTSLDIGGVIIRNINVNYTDEQSNSSVSLSKFNLSVGHVQEDIPFPVSADFTVAIKGDRQPITAAITAAGKLTFNLAGKRLSLSDFLINSEFTGKIFPAAQLKLKLLVDAEIDARAEKIKFDKLLLTQGNLSAQTTIGLSNFSAPSITGTLKIAEFSPRAYLKSLGIAVPEFQDDTAFNRCATNLDFKLNNDRLDISNLVLSFDDTTLDATVSIADLKAPAYVLNMEINTLDLDRYAVTTPNPEGGRKVDPSVASDQQEPESAKPGDTPLLPVQALRDLAFHGKVNINSLKVAKLRLSEVLLKAEGKDGLIRLQPLSAHLYDGSLTVTGSIDVRPETPVMQLTKTLHKVQMGPLCVDMLGREELSGQADVEVEVTTRGLRKNDLIRNSNGTLQLSLADGKIAKLQILETIRLAKALLEQKEAPTTAKSQPTGFATLTASGKLSNGVFVNNDLVAESDLMKVTGKGKIDFVTDQIDYLLTVYLTDRVERDEQTGLVDLGKTPIPYRISGTLSNLKQSASITELAKTKAKEVLLDTLGKQLGKDNEQKDDESSDTGSLIKQGLQGLFGN